MPSFPVPLIKILQKNEQINHKGFLITLSLGIGYWHTKRLGQVWNKVVNKHKLKMSK